MHTCGYNGGTDCRQCEAEELSIYDGEPDIVCEWCGQATDYVPCADVCECPDCENERALSDEYDAQREMI